MKLRSLGSVPAAGTLLLALSTLPVLAQEPPPRFTTAVEGREIVTRVCRIDDQLRFHACAREKMKTFNPPRTPDGRPNMAGYWDRAFTSQEIEEHPAMFGQVAGQSFLIDPPDRKIPYHPWALEFRKGMFRGFISPLAMCALPGVPRHTIGTTAHQIIQTPGYLVHLLEASHTYRIIPITSRPHVGSGLRLWQGDARGNWEGNTLVVDVTNANGLAWLDNAGNFFSDALHVVERFTMIDADVIHYEARVDDPGVYTRPWAMVAGLLRNTTPGQELLEEACHETNHHLEAAQSIGLKPYPGVVPPGRR